MSRSVPQELIAAARAYEGLHVPALFREWAPRVVKAAGVESGHSVLDVACGTGVLAREAATRAGDKGFVAGADPNPGMLAVAAELAPDLEWREATAEDLPYADGTFDRVVSQFGLMFFSDRRKALAEMKRVLRQGGRMAVAVWDRLERSDAYSTEVRMLERLAGREAADALRAPFVLGDTTELSGLFESAGLDPVAIDTLVGQARFPGVRPMVEADLRGWLPVMGVVLEEDQINCILEESETELAAFVNPDGQAVFDSPAHIVVCQA